MNDDTKEKLENMLISGAKSNIKLNSRYYAKLGMFMLKNNMSVNDLEKVKNELTKKVLDNPGLYE